MRSIEAIMAEAKTQTPKLSVAPKIRKKSLAGNILDLYREENEALTETTRILRQKLLASDQREAALTRTARSATEDADALLEAVSILSAVVYSDSREGRRARAEARKVLESRGVLPPSTLGSSRNRPKTVAKKKSS